MAVLVIVPSDVQMGFDRVESKPGFLDFVTLRAKNARKRKQDRCDCLRRQARNDKRKKSSTGDLAEMGRNVLRPYKRKME
jgi:hypothetical protein